MDEAKKVCKPMDWAGLKEYDARPVYPWRALKREKPSYEQRTLNPPPPPPPLTPPTEARKSVTEQDKRIAQMKERRSQREKEILARMLNPDGGRLIVPDTLDEDVAMGDPLEAPSHLDSSWPVEFPSTSPANRKRSHVIGLTEGGSDEVDVSPPKRQRLSTPSPSKTPPLTTPDRSPYSEPAILPSPGSPSTTPIPSAPQRTNSPSRTLRRTRTYALLPGL
jgi:hypothetical protein